MHTDRNWASLRRNRIGRRRLLAAGAAGGIASGALALAGCGGHIQNAGKTQGSAASTGAGTPRPGGRLAVNVNNDPFDWDLSYAGKTLPNGTGTALAYESLLSYKTGPNVRYGDLQIQPSLAEKWESPGAQTYTFHLRQGVKFTNLPPVNGRALTSNDVQ